MNVVADNGHVMASNNGPPRELYSPKEVEHILSISHAQLYRLLAAGKLTALKIGRGTYIQRSALDKFLAGLPAADLGPKDAA